MSASLPVLDERDTLATYAYSYPHKSAYRPLAPPVPLAEAWRDEHVDHLSLYLHVPFCEMRCGFCNLFTQSQPASDVVQAYLETLARQASIIRQAVPQAHFDQFAVGGGTPTFLSARQLAAMLNCVEQSFGQSIRNLPTSVECSPATATQDRLTELAQFGVRRLSIGVQSFVEQEAASLGRPQTTRALHAALTAVRTCGVPWLNIDLIYGHAGQTRQSWQRSLQEALHYRPDELYLYPLYVRPETGLANTRHAAAPHRADLYRQGRDFLLAAGYGQVSLRCFRLLGDEMTATYACQRDGMIGLGCGARSYTRRLHYATRFAVSQRGIRAILSDWIGQSDGELSLATHGIWMSDEEQRRRFVILSLLQAEGLDMAEYACQFQSSVADDIPELALVRDRGWLDEGSKRLALSEEGLTHSEEVGPLLYSNAVREVLRTFTKL